MTTGARIRNEKIHYSCLERSYFISTYRPKNLRPALERDTALDPVKDQWQPQWEDYLRTLAPPNAVK
jgi:hypothetical protein